MKQSLIKCVTAFTLLSLGHHASAITLGALENPGDFDLSSNSSSINYGINLDTWNYRVRLPSGYSPDETYGLVSYNSAGSIGTPPTAWLPMLDKYRLIWVGGDNIGNNDQLMATRRGVTLLGAMRMTELYPNIDPNRIYASGSSGGSRMSSALVLMRDDFFKGMIVSVGITLADDLPTDFITNTWRGDESYYWTEAYFWGDDSATTARFALQTLYNANNQASEGDFREEEILSAHHLSMIPNGNQSKVITYPGVHNDKLEVSFEESAKWINHPLIPVIEDSFENADPATNPGAGNGFTTVYGSATETTVSGASSGSVGVVQLAADTEIRSKDVFDWNEDYGIRLTTALRSDYAAAYNQRMEVGLVPADLRDGSAFRLIIEQTGATTKTAQLVVAQRDGTPVTLCSFTFEGGDEPINRTSTDRAYFRNEASIDDGPGNNFRGLDVHWFMDDDKFQINFRQNIVRNSFSSDLSTPPILLIDRWTVQGRWSDMGLTELIDNMKRTNEWRVSLKNEPIDAGSSNTAYVDYVQVHSAQPGKITATDGSESMGLRFDQQSDASQLLAFEAEAFHRQEVQGLHRWIATSEGTGYSGAGAVTTAANTGSVYSSANFANWSPRLDYGLKFSSSGSYKVWVRAKASSATDDACWVGLNEDGSGAVNLSGFATGAYSWVSATIDVTTTGENWLHLWAGKDGLIVDQILLTLDLSYTPSGAVSVPAASTMALYFGPPLPPLGFSLAPGNRSASLDWQDNFEADVVGYNVYRGLESGVYGASPVAQGVANSEYTESGLLNNTTYYYVLTAVDSEGAESEFSQEMSVTPSADLTYLLDIVGDTSSVTTGGEFADYSSLGFNLPWGDSSDDDGEVSLSISLTSFTGDISISKWNNTTYIGAGKEINYMSVSTTLSDASDAIAQNAFVAIKLDSTDFNSKEFTVDSISLSQWRHSSLAQKGFQLAYDADGDGFDAGDLIGSPVTITTDGVNNTFVISSELTTDYATQHEIRLYYWGATFYATPTHLFNLEVSYRQSLVDPSDNTAPPTPGNLVAEGVSGALALTWDASTAADFATYTLYRSATSGSGYTVIASDLIDNTYVDSTPVAGETWYYAVTANDFSGNESAFSAVAGITIDRGVDIIGNTTGVAGGEFADYSGVSDGGAWPDSSDNDGLLDLVVSRTGTNGDVSVATFHAVSYVGSNAEIVYRNGTDALATATAAINNRAFISIQLDSTGFGSDEFLLDSIAVTQWRNGSASATNFQFAYDADGDGIDADDLIGSPVNNNASGPGNSFLVSSTLTTLPATNHEVRLYYWGGGVFTGNTHLFKVEAVYTLDTQELFSDWISGFDVGGATAPGDDFDGDGIPNAVENYFGTDPSAYNAGLSIGQVLSGENVTFEFSHPISDTPASDLTATYRWSRDLVTFYDSAQSDPAGTTVTFATGVPSEGVVTVVATATGAATDRIFVTVSITSN